MSFEWIAVSSDQIELASDGGARRVKRVVVATKKWRSHAPIQIGANVDLIPVELDTAVD